MNKDKYERLKELARELDIVLGVWTVDDIEQALVDEQQPETEEQAAAIKAKARELWTPQFKASLQLQVNEVDGLGYFIKLYEKTEKLSVAS